MAQRHLKEDSCIVNGNSKEDKSNLIRTFIAHSDVMYFKSIFIPLTGPKMDGTRKHSPYTKEINEKRILAEPEYNLPQLLIGVGTISIYSSQSLKCKLAQIKS